MRQKQRWVSRYGERGIPKKHLPIAVVIERLRRRRGLPIPEELAKAAKENRERSMLPKETSLAMYQSAGEGFVLVGSRAHGTAHADSDTDIISAKRLPDFVLGCFMPYKVLHGNAQNIKRLVVGSQEKHLKRALGLEELSLGEIKDNLIRIAIVNMGVKKAPLGHEDETYGPAIVSLPYSFRGSPKVIRHKATMHDILLDALKRLVKEGKMRETKEGKYAWVK